VTGCATPSILASRVLLADREWSGSTWREERVVSGRLRGRHPRLKNK
jgi:hypothetical protein